ncbi:MAG TPA: PIG-L family deacetylase [Microlunatus sp.]
MNRRTTGEVTPPGFGPEVWADVRRTAEHLDPRALVRELAVPTPVPLVVLAAHPDDETLGLGRLMHQWVRELGPVTAIVASAGEACFDQVGPRPADLAARRLEEWHAALSVLGVDRRHYLGLPDGSLADCGPALSAALRLVADDWLRSHDQVVLAAPWRRDPHPDHRAVGRAAGAVARQLHRPLVEFGVWMTYWSTPDDLLADQRRLLVLDTDQAAERAHGLACAEFASQLQSMAPGRGPVVPPAMLGHHHQQLILLPVQADPHHPTALPPSDRTGETR